MPIGDSELVAAAAVERYPTTPPKTGARGAVSHNVWGRSSLVAREELPSVPGALVEVAEAGPNIRAGKPEPVGAAVPAPMKAVEVMADRAARALVEEVGALMRMKTSYNDRPATAAWAGLAGSWSSHSRRTPMKKLALVSTVVFLVGTLAVLGCATFNPHLDASICFEHPDYGHVCVKIDSEGGWGFRLTSTILTPDILRDIVPWIQQRIDSMH